MAENDKVKGLEAVVAAMDDLANRGLPALEHQSVSMGLQAIVMDEIVVDTDPAVVIRVPVSMISRMGDFLEPWLTRPHGNDLLVRLELTFARIMEAVEVAEAHKPVTVKLSLEREGVLVAATAVGKHPAAPLFTEGSIVIWSEIADGEINPILSTILALATRAGDRAKASCG